MDLETYFRGLPDDTARETFAIRCGTTFLHLRNVACYGKPCGIPLAVAIERETGGAITRPMLRPHDYRDIWPELAAAEA